MKKRLSGDELLTAYGREKTEILQKELKKCRRVCRKYNKERGIKYNGNNSKIG